MASKGKEMKSNRIKVTTTLDPELWHKFRIRAVQENLDCNDILEKLIAEYLKKAKSSK